MAAQDELLEFLAATKCRLGYAVMFDVFPHLLVRVQFGRVRRQKEQTQATVQAGQVVAYWPAPMKAATIENEKDRPAGVVHQALQELDKDRSVDAAFYHHEA